MAFMKYSDRPDLRERFYRLYTGRNTKGEYSNVENMSRIAAVRLEIAKLLGSQNYAQHSLQRTMAETPKTSTSFSTSSATPISPLSSARWPN